MISHSHPELGVWVTEYQGTSDLMDDIRSLDETALAYHDDGLTHAAETVEARADALMTLWELATHF